ncbi:MAG TPA: hypothetical protein PLD55_08125 [bacterium]|nr:hypothetical protein [bacterium]HQM84632.1 hypothetical protein [bacterium]
MKKCLVLLMMLSAGFFSCSSKTSTGSDSDNFISDKDPLSENENSDNETDDKSGHVNDDVVLDDDSSSVSDNESDDEDTQDHICDPNPCETEKNIAENRTRCMHADEGRSYTCECDVSYHSSEGLCCQPYSNNVEGECVCNTYYVTPDYDEEQCVPECSENTIEGLNGYCPEGEICQQGICITDRCYGYECPENSTCSTKNDAPFCQCDTGLQMSDGKCCPLNSTNISGSCECNQGFEFKNDKCEPLASNKCVPNPCEGSGNPLHKNVCVLDGSIEGYHCDCNENYVADEDGCILVEFDFCPEGLQCLSGYCVPFDLSNEQCIEDGDCREFPGATTVCSSPHAAGGICIGCAVASDCPGNTQCYETYGTCALMCDDDTDCPYGKCYGTGYCGQKKCYSNEDCFGGTLCIDSDGSGEGMCQRIPCKETLCSKTNPGGSCEDAGASCIAGECINSCDPNPCKEINRGTCEIKLGVPTCMCDDGTQEINGKCEPVSVTKCPDGFTCASGVCADKSDPGFVCAESGDCEDADLVCSPVLPSGVCSGCTYPSECPHGGAETSDCVSGYCLKTCFIDTDCNDGMKCLGSGYCGKQDCVKPSDCPSGYTCSSSGRCSRIPCS